MKQTNKHIQFEVSTKFNPMMGMFGGAPQAGDDEDNTSTSSDDEYAVLDEEGFNLLSRALGGG